MDKTLMGLPLPFWYTVMGAFLAIAGGIIGKLFSEWREQLAKDQELLTDAHEMLVVLTSMRQLGHKEWREGIPRKFKDWKILDYELAVRGVHANIRTKRYRYLAVELASLGYHSDENCQCMLRRLREAMNPKVYAEMERQWNKAVADGRARSWDEVNLTV